MKYCPYCMSELAEQDAQCPVCHRAPQDYQSPPHALRQGAMLNNRYLVGGIIGEGGFGITYIGLDTLLQFRVAIKEFFPNGMVNRNNTVSNEVLSISTESAKELFSKSRENFLREARTLAKFTDEAGVVAVRDFFEENRTVYIVMEYLDGITLKSYLKQVGNISPYNTVCLLMPVFRSLRKIHAKGLIHRDISPDNIMLVGEQVKLLDFGAAREFADERSLSVMLKHGYAPMEQYRRHGVQGAWTDVYAICAVMYRCITGSVPPDAPERVFEDELKMPSELGIEIDPAFEDVLRRGLAIKPDERIQSIDELLEELDKVPEIDIDEPYTRSESDGDDEEKEPVSVSVSAPQPPVQAVKDNAADARLSEYVPHFSDSREEVKPQPQPEQSEQKPAPPKKKSKLPLIIGISAAAVVIGAAITAAVLIFLSNKPAPVPTPTFAVYSATTAAPTEQAATEATGETGETGDPDSTQPFTFDVNDVQYPDLGDYIHIDDGFLTVDESLFGQELDDAAQRFMPATLFWSGNHPVFSDDAYRILCLPVESPVNYGGYNGGVYLETVDLIFRDNKLVVIQYEKHSAYNNEVVAQAKQRYGAPASEEAERAVWELDGGVSYETCMVHYDNRELDLTDFFTQRYYSPDESPR